jgi:hypothetical protein
MKNIRILILTLVLSVMLISLFAAVHPVLAGDPAPQIDCIGYYCGYDPEGCKYKPGKYSECDNACWINGSLTCLNGWTCVGACK